MQPMRILHHLLAPHWTARFAFSRAALARIGEAVTRSERAHRGEIRFVVEGGLPFDELLRGVHARARAEALFARLRVWDTEGNSGVLLYVQLVDRRIEIVADRGIAARVAQSEWDAICRGMEAAFRERNFEAGALEAIARVTALLAAHFPAGDDNPNELPDRPVVL